jgi:RNA polymerase sigma factor (sigma-70 family)
MADDLSSHLVSLYRNDVQQVPPLSEQEHYQLIEAVVQHRDKAAWNRLVEHYLGAVFRYISKRCPPHEKHLLPDMLAEANLRLLQAFDGFEPQGKQAASYLMAYLLLYARGALYETIYHNRVIRIPATTLREALQEGTIAQFNRIQPVSLDRVLPWEEDETIERIMSPLLSPEAAPESPPALRAQVEEWLSHLPASHESIVRMHYGLQADDERCYSTWEIAHRLGCTLSVVHHALKSARLRLKLLAEGSARFREQEGRQVVKGVFHRSGPPPTLTAEQEEQLMQCAYMLSSQGETISTRKLSRMSGLTPGHTEVFLRQHRHALPQESMKGTPAYRKRVEQAQRERIRQVYERRQTQGEPITLTALAQEAHVDPQAVRAFLRECGQTYRQQRARASQERIRQVYERWCAQGKRINMKKIADEAHAKYHTVRTFIQEDEQQQR